MIKELKVFFLCVFPEALIKNDQLENNDIIMKPSYKKKKIYFLFLTVRLDLEFRV